MTLARAWLCWATLAVCVALPAQAQVQVRWTFNSAPADGDPFTGTVAPSIGLGTASGWGGTSTGFASGSPTDPEAASGDNSSFFASGFPGLNVGSGTRGVRCAGATGASPSVSYSQFCPGNASAWWRFEYSLDGTTFTSAGLPAEAPGGPGEYRFPQALSDAWSEFEWNLSSVGGAANNPNFAFRIVAIFSPGATTYVNVFAGTPSGYQSGSTVRFDVVTIAGGTSPVLGACCDGAACVAQVESPQCAGPGRMFLSGSPCNPTGEHRIPCCKANFNRLSGITVQDLFDYLGAWFAKEMRADVNGAAPSGGAGVTVQDLFDYLGAWFQKGCS